MQRNKFEELHKEKVCALDIDGVLNYYPDSWVNFVNTKYGHNFEDLNQMKRALTFKAYADYKHTFRKEGFECNAHANQDASFVTKRLRQMGYKIILLTSRPFQQYRSMFVETVDWLKQNDIVYDGIIWERHKHVRVLEEIPHLRFMVEDNAYYANLVGKWGYLCFLVSNKYNVGQEKEGVIRINNLIDIFNYPELIA